MALSKPIQGVEIVGIGHPDKIADWVSDLCVDFVKSWDLDGRAAFETLIKNQHFAIFGEYKVSRSQSYTSFDFETNLRFYLTQKLNEVGYDEPNFTFELQEQSREISVGVDNGGAGDQGVIYNGATSDYNHVHPAVTYIEKLKRFTESIGAKTKYGKPRLYFRSETPGISPGWDFKALLSFETGNIFKPTNLTIALLCNHIYQKELKDKFIKFIKENDMQLPPNILFNAAGTFETGGSDADAGATNRKLAVDNHYGLVPHGGGGLSGKDLTKVDRSATHYLRWVAIQLVEMLKMETIYHVSIVVGVTYAIGRKEITGLEVRRNGSVDSRLTEFTLRNFDFSPKHMENKWKINSYAELSQSNPSTGNFPWNNYGRSFTNELYRKWTNFREEIYGTPQE